MSGRPPSSYLYPRVWQHLEEAGLAGNHITLKNLNLTLRNNSDFSLPYGSQLSTRLFEQKFRVERPSLIGFKTAADIVYLVNYKRRALDLDPIPEAECIVSFNHAVIGLSDKLDPRTSEHGQAETQRIAAGTSLTEETIMSVASGRLVPREVALDIARVAGLTSESIVARVVGRGNTPANSEDSVKSISSKLAA